MDLHSRKPRGHSPVLAVTQDSRQRSSHISKDHGRELCVVHSFSEASRQCLMSMTPFIACAYIWATMLHLGGVV